MAGIETAQALRLEQPAHRPVAARSVLCLHCSTSSSRQWASLATTLTDRPRIIAPDLLGYGDNAIWPHDRTLGLDDEIARLLPLIAEAGAPVDVVGHSFGAAVAVKLTLDFPQLVRSLCIYEPVLFGLLREDAASAPAHSEILMTSALVGSSLARGDLESAAARFIDYWSGDGTWSAMSTSRRAGVRDRMHKVRADFEALFADETTLAELARVSVPVLCLSGDRSPGSARRLVDILSATFPRAQSERFEGAGHMGPLTHADEVNSRIARFFRFLSRFESRDDWRTPYTTFGARAA